MSFLPSVTILVLKKSPVTIFMAKKRTFDLRINPLLHTVAIWPHTVWELETHQPPRFLPQRTFTWLETYWAVIFIVAIYNPTFHPDTPQPIQNQDFRKNHFFQKYLLDIGLLFPNQHSIQQIAPWRYVNDRSINANQAFIWFSNQHPGQSSHWITRNRIYTLLSAINTSHYLKIKKFPARCAFFGHCV